MKTYIVNKNSFEEFFINNFHELRNDSKFIVHYLFDKGDIVKQYRGYYSEGISILTDDIIIVNYNAYVLHNELKLQHIIRLKELAENQQKIIM